MTPLERARATSREAIDIRVAKSGRLMVHLARPDGSGGSAEAATHAEAFIYVARIREQLDNDLPLVRGPAAEPQEHNL